MAINKGFQFTSATNGKQRRRKGRVRTNIQGSYTLSGKNKSIECTIVDLGMGGLTLQTGVVLYQGEKIRTNFLLEDSSLELDGVVCRITGKNAVLKFDDISEVNSSKIQEYINKIYYKESV